jgi:hypothetical protein
MKRIIGKTKDSGWFPAKEKGDFAPNGDPIPYNSPPEGDPYKYRPNKGGSVVTKGGGRS